MAHCQSPYFSKSFKREFQCGFHIASLIWVVYLAWLFLNGSIPITYSNCDVLQHLSRNNWTDWVKLYSGDNIKEFYILDLALKTSCSSFSYTKYKLMTWQVLKMYLFINILLTRIKLLKYTSFSRMSLGWKADIFLSHYISYHVGYCHKAVTRKLK